MYNQNISGLLRFQGQWRSYQKRVLDKADQYLRDKRLHIVAAPGSGKTTLGIELIRRLGSPALILAPSINIRNQWLARVREAYLPEGTDTEGLLSNSIRKPGLITAITYQALHSLIRKGVSEEEPEEDCGEELEEEQGDGAEEGSMDKDFFELVRMAIQNFSKIPVTSMVSGLAG